MKKRLSSLLLAALILFSLFSGCTGDVEQTNEPSSNPANASTPQPSTAEGGDQTGQDTENEPSTLLSEELVTLDIWSPFSTNYGSVITSYNDCLGYKEIEKKTNVHVNWLLPAIGSENEQFQLLIASSSYPDAIINFTQYYSPGLENAVDLGIALKLDDIINANMPNYKALISDPMRVRNAKTDSGYIASLACIQNESEAPWAGMCIRKDWLDQVGKEIPETYDELHDVLVSFKDDIGVESPMSLGNSGDSMTFNMSTGYNVIQDMLQIDGTVYYGPMQPGYRQYLETMSSWYSEGLIDRDFTTRNPFSDAPAYYFSGKVGYMWGFTIVGTFDELMGQAADEMYNCIGVKNPVENKGDPNNLGLIQTNMGSGTIITVDCKDTDLVSKWFDYLYSEDAALALSYGVEGHTFFYDSNLEPTLDSAAMEEYYGQPFSACRQCNGPIVSAFYRYIYQGRALLKADHGNIVSYNDAGAEWGKDKDSYRISSFVTMTAEEGNEYNSIIQDINTLLTEVTVKVIIGDQYISAYDDFVEQIKSMGIERAIEITQDALDRYLAR